MGTYEDSVFIVYGPPAVDKSVEDLPSERRRFPFLITKRDYIQMSCQHVRKE